MDTAGKFSRILEATSVIFAFTLVLNPSHVNTVRENSLVWTATRITNVCTQVSVRVNKQFITEIFQVVKLCWCDDDIILMT